MAIASYAKAKDCFRDLFDRLTLRFPSTGGAGYLNSIRQANDANGWPMLFLSNGGNEAAGQPVVALRMKAVSAVSADVFGAPLTAYAPHTIEIAYEADSGSLNMPRAVQASDLDAVKYETFKIGARDLIEAIANTTAVTEANMNSATPILDIEDLYNPTKGV